METRIENAAPEPCATPSKAETVLQAASRVFLTHGFSASTTDMIQREANVSKSTLYAHYPNKEALFTAVIEARCALLAVQLDDIPVAPGNLRQTLRALGRAYLEAIVAPEGLALFRVVVAESPRFPQLSRSFYRVGPSRVTARASEHLARAAAAGEVDVTSIGVEGAAQVFTGLIRGEPHLHYLMHPDARPSEEQVERWVEQAVTTFLLAFGRAGKG